MRNQSAFPVSINNLFDPRLRDVDPGMHGSPSLEISGCTTVRHQDHHFCGTSSLSKFKGPKMVKKNTPLNFVMSSIPV